MSLWMHGHSIWEIYFVNRVDKLPPIRRMGDLNQHGETKMTRFEEFKANAQSQITNYRNMMQTTGVWDLKKSAAQLQELQNKMSWRLMRHLFGDDLGEHMWYEFREQNHGCILSWFNRLNEEYYVYVLHEVKNNTTLYANS